MIVKHYEIQELVLLFQGGIGIPVIKGVLMEKVFSDHLGCFHDHSVRTRERFNADKPHNLFKFGLLCEQPHGLNFQAGKALIDIFLERFVEYVIIERIGTEPAYGGEMSLECQLVFQAPEHLYHPQCGLNHRIG